MKVPLVDLRAQHATIRDEVMQAAREVIEAQSFVLGEPVARFEATLAKMCGAREAVGVASGTDALVLALRAAGIGTEAGDSVVTTPLTFVATVEAIVNAGARPVFADVDARTLTMDPESARRAVKRARARGQRVRALLPVHLFGQCAEMGPLLALAREEGLVVVEDAAQAIGARDAAGIAGSMGDAGCFSFFPSKGLGAWGDGGAVTTQDVGVAARVRSLRQHGRVAEDEFAEVGTNSRLDALHAAVLDVKARHVEAWTRGRREAAARYRALLAGVRGVTLPEEREGAFHTYSVFVVRAEKRDALAAHLGARGVACRAYYARPVQRQGPYVGVDDAAELDNVERASGELLALPMFAEISEEQQGYVSEAVRAMA